METINKPILKQKKSQEKKLPDASELGPNTDEAFDLLRRGMLELYEAADNSRSDEDKFYDAYNQILHTASLGYLPAQDYLGYMFKTGLGDLIPANYTLSMNWQFLAGSNGNGSTVDRLKIFFTRSYNDVFSIDGIENILSLNGINGINYEYELGKLFCDAMVDEVGITLEALIAAKPEYQPSTIQLAQFYEKARQAATLSVIEYLKRAAK